MGMNTSKLVTSITGMGMNTSKLVTSIIQFFLIVRLYQMKHCLLNDQVKVPKNLVVLLLFVQLVYQYSFQILNVIVLTFLCFWETLGILNPLEDNFKTFLLSPNYKSSVVTSSEVLCFASIAIYKMVLSF